MNDDTWLYDEEWRPVVGYEGRYEVSDQGRVRSLDHWMISQAITRAGTKYFRKGKVLRPQTVSQLGYHAVAIDRKMRYVHRLVLEAFVGPCPNKHWEGHHIDGNPQNNKLNNLEWVHRKVNKARAVAAYMAVRARMRKYYEKQSRDSD